MHTHRARHTPMELVPFTATTAGVALTLFGLALTVGDGLMVVLAGLFIAITVGLAIYPVL